MSRVKSYQLTGQPLIDRAHELGIPIEDAINPGHTEGVIGTVAVYDQEEIRRRVFSAERSKREHRLWTVECYSNSK